MPMGARTRITCQSTCIVRMLHQIRRCRLVNTNGEKRQMSGFGHSSRSPPPANPQPTAKGSEPNSPAKIGGSPHIRPTTAPA